MQKVLLIVHQLFTRCRRVGGGCSRGTQAGDVAWRKECSGAHNAER